eukprot:GHVN01034425.1.p1 GENE.GHVN01034425.1~~GHVN01034425.1.p1  ORF type:complete len:485 (-),score=52.38 GHVN01034425.1:35-1489(-)
MVPGPHNDTAGGVAMTSSPVYTVSDSLFVSPSWTRNQKHDLTGGSVAFWEQADTLKETDGRRPNWDGVRPTEPHWGKIVGWMSTWNPSKHFEVLEESGEETYGDRSLTNNYGANERRGDTDVINWYNALNLKSRWEPLYHQGTGGTHAPYGNNSKWIYHRSQFDRLSADPQIPTSSKTRPPRSLAAVVARQQVRHESVPGRGEGEMRQASGLKLFRSPVSKGRLHNEPVAFDETGRDYFKITHSSLHLTSVRYKVDALLPPGTWRDVPFAPFPPTTPVTPTLLRSLGGTATTKPQQWRLPRLSFAHNASREDHAKIEHDHGQHSGDGESVNGVRLRDGLELEIEAPRCDEGISDAAPAKIFLTTSQFLKCLFHPDLHVKGNIVKAPAAGLILRSFELHDNYRRFESWPEAPDHRETEPFINEMVIPRVSAWWRGKFPTDASEYFNRDPAMREGTMLSLTQQWLLALDYLALGVEGDDRMKLGIF